MRENKFRGKRIDTGEWVYGYLVVEPNGKSRIYWKPFEECSTNTYHFVIPETVGQYIERKDKIGKDIYEGDEIQCGCSNKVGSTSYYNHIVTFRWGYFFPFNQTSIKRKDIEIVGNIHENPELLKGENNVK